MASKNQAVVTDTFDVGDDMVLVTATPRNPELVWTPGQAVAVVVDPDGASMRDRWRHYTVRGHDPERGTMDFLLTRHDSSTPGGRWIESIEVGSTFTFMGPGGHPVFRPGAEHYFLVGDRTSLASMVAMLDAMSANSPTGQDTSPDVEVLVATPDPDAAILPTIDPWKTRWIGATAVEEIRERTVAALPLTFPSGTQAYVTGEMATIRAVRDVLIDRGVAKRSIGSNAHWTPGRRGM